MKKLRQIFHNFSNEGLLEHEEKQKLRVAKAIALTQVDMKSFVNTIDILIDKRKDNPAAYKGAAGLLVAELPDGIDAKEIRYVEAYKELHKICAVKDVMVKFDSAIDFASEFPFKKLNYVYVDVNKSYDKSPDSDLLAQPKEHRKNPALVY